MDIEELADGFAVEAEKYLAEHGESTISFGFTVNGARTVRYVRTPGAEHVQVPDASSIYEIGSVSKLFLVAVLGVLEGRGLLQLDDPISKHLPSHLKLRPEIGSLTIRQLATHSAGFANTGTVHDQIIASEHRGSEPPWGYYTHYLRYKKEHLYADLECAQLQYPVGEGYEYSVLGMGTVGHVLSLVTGQSFEELLKQHVTDPLGIPDLAYELNTEQLARVMFAYDRLGEPLPNWYHDVMLPQGGLRGKLEDLLTSAEANLKAGREDDDSELSRSLRLARQIHWRAPEGYTLPGTEVAMPFHQGLAWMAFKTADPQRFNWYHGGTTLFYNAGLGVNDEHGIGFAMLNSSRTGVVDTPTLYPMALGWFMQAIAVAATADEATHRR